MPLPASVGALALLLLAAPAAPTMFMPGPYAHPAPLHARAGVNFVEVGSSDHAHLAELPLPPGARGVLIEPVRKYFNALPHLPGIRRLQTAVTGEAAHPPALPFYYVSPADVDSPVYNFNESMKLGLRGSGSLGKPHPWVVERLGLLGMPHLQRVEQLPVMTLPEVCELYGIGHIDLLKTDAEGNDAAIITNYLSYLEGLAGGHNETLRALLPGAIYFEANWLHTEDQILPLIAKLKDLGYISDSDAKTLNILAVRQDSPYKCGFLEDRSTMYCDNWVIHGPAEWW